MKSSKVSKRLVVTLVVVAVVVSLPGSTAASSTPAQNNQGSAAWAAAFWFWGAGGYNQLNVIVTNVGTQPVALCVKDWASNGTEIVSTCSKDAVTPLAQWRFRLFASSIGYSGTVIVYSQDSATPIAPYGQVTIDQNSNKVVDAAVGLQWVPTSIPSS